MIRKNSIKNSKFPNLIEKNLNNIYLEIENDLDADDFKVNKLIINKKLKDNSKDKAEDLTNLFNVYEINNVKNWIELKKLINQVFSEII